MLKLPLCPYCGAIYRYGEVKKFRNKENIKCRHCGKEFSVSKTKGRIILITVAAVILIALNILMFNFIKGLTVLGCFIITVAAVSLTVILFPFTTRFKKKDDEK